MIVDKMLNIGLLLAAALTGILALIIFGRPYFLVCLCLLGALVELDLSRYQGSEARGHIREISVETLEGADRQRRN